MKKKKKRRRRNPDYFASLADTFTQTHFFFFLLFIGYHDALIIIECSLDLSLLLHLRSFCQKLHTSILSIPIRILIRLLVSFLVFFLSIVRPDPLTPLPASHVLPSFSNLLLFFVNSYHDRRWSKEQKGSKLFLNAILGLIIFLNTVLTWR